MSLKLITKFSLLECQDYKALVSRVYSIGGLCLDGKKCRRYNTVREFKCSNFSMLTEGKEKAILKEFPHMAGQSKLFQCSEFFQFTFLMIQLLAGKTRTEVLSLTVVVRLSVNRLCLLLRIVVEISGK